ncbi:alpha-amylase family glycosyl hydrolase [Thermosipho atlanticus]|uniref:Alpha-amylase n=1 Tax=Thermosipho atlanticus DSM 15807 TaxID=1123380 RepID=A0A1M5U5S2_9BACT|nr:alpha-amylase family glycosyl hydrolase [Thermosipho atlanticus]SHH58299.1 alpha-amylase [Thermosipho atlanticus DSM 15807]
MARKLIVILFATILLVLTSCVPFWFSSSPEQSSNIMYLIFVRSFYDSNGDGIGDLRGVGEKASYLKELGIDIVWLMPINEAVSYHGYDPINLYSIESDYGSFDDFFYMVSMLHKNGIRVVLDLVINHTSNKNPYFLDAIENTTNSKYWDWFIMSLDDHSGQNHWHYMINSKGQMVWYFGLFSETMPDYNYDNPSVREEIRRVIDFWLERGVDGFRFDALKNIYGYDYDDGIFESATFAKELAQYVYSKKPNAIIVGEVYSGDQNVLKSFYPMPVFNFTFMYNVRSNPEGADWLVSNSYLWYDSENFLFIDNHDLSDRFISNLEENLYKNSGSPRFYAKAQFALLNTLMVSMKGIPVIYYGNEIGQKGFKWNTDPYDVPMREPFQWYASKRDSGQTYWTKLLYSNAKITFGNANQDGAMYDDPDDGISVEEQEKISNSLLNYFKTIFNIRKRYKSLSIGEMSIKSDQKNLVVIERSYYNQKALVLINLDPFKENYYVIPTGYKQVFYADLNSPANGFIFSTEEKIIKQSITYTVKPRQVYIFVYE